MAFEWLFQVFMGFFIGGVVVTLIMMVLSGISISHGMDSGTHVDTNTDLAADVHGDITTDVHGDITTDVHGDITTDVHGDITTDVHGDITTDVHAEVTSSVDGHDTGDSEVDHDFSSHDLNHDSSVNEGAHDSGYDSQVHVTGGHGHGVHSLDSNIAVNLDVAAGALSPEAGLIASDKGQKAPFLLLFAGFLMFCGALGLSFFGLLNVNIFLLLGIAILPPFLLNKMLGKIWQKITKSETYVIPAELPLIGQKVRVVMPVDASGGEVRIDASSSPFGAQRLPVMPLYPEKTFGQGEEIYICDYAMVKRIRFYLVDDDPSEIRKTKQVQI